MLFLWQFPRAVVAWAPESGNFVWANVADIQVGSENLWQASQVVGKPDATWSTGVLAVL